MDVSQVEALSILDDIVTKLVPYILSLVYLAERNWFHFCFDHKAGLLERKCQRKMGKLSI